MITSAVSISLILFIFSWGDRAFGFEPAIHNEISMRAFQQIQRCRTELETLVPRAVLDAALASAREVARGSADEDKTELGQRLANWHFFDRHRNLRHGLLDESLDRIFAIRVNQFGTPESLGRIVHYVQDMFVPAHVVPVFHGGPFGPHDEFDGYKVASSLKDAAVTSLSCANLRASTARRRELHLQKARIDLNRDFLESSVRFTLDRLEETIPGSNDSWKKFWPEPASKTRDSNDVSSMAVAVGVPAARFGRYHETFGDEHVAPRDTFNQFYLVQYRAAVAASAELILLNLAR